MIICVPLAAAGRDESVQPRILVVYTYDAFPEALETSIQDLFSGSDPLEIKLERFQDTGELYSRILLEKDKPKADVVIGLDNTYVAEAISLDIFQEYKPKGVELIAPELLIDDGYRLIPFDYGNVTLNYDSERLPNPPQSWEELLTPEFRNRIIMLNPATSSPGRNFLLFTIAEFGEDGYLEFWKKLEPNILTVTAGWTEGYGLYAQGEAPIVLSYDTSPAYHLHYEGEDRYKNLLFDGKAYAQIEVAGILRETQNRAAARQLMDHLLSKQFQELIPLNQIMYPVRPDVILPEAFNRAEGATVVVNMDERHVAENFERWLSEWEAAMR